MSHLRFDRRDVLRRLRRDTRYTATAVLTLALTIGATTAMFSIINGVLLRPLKYRESHQLVTIREVEVELADRYPVLPVNGHHFEMWRSQSTDRRQRTRSVCHHHDHDSGGSRGRSHERGRRASGVEDQSGSGVERRVAQVVRLGVEPHG
jgi:hypothetical protein